jgi:hypothetical protein
VQRDRSNEELSAQLADREDLLSKHLAAREALQVPPHPGATAGGRRAEEARKCCPLTSFAETAMGQGSDRAACPPQRNITLRDQLAQNLTRQLGQAANEKYALEACAPPTTFSLFAPAAPHTAAPAISTLCDKHYEG